MKDMTKILKRAVDNAPSRLALTGTEDLKMIMLKCANVLEFHGEDKEVEAYFKKYAVYEADFVKVALPELYTLIESDVITRKAKAEAKKNKAHHNTVKAIEKKLSIEAQLEKYRKEVAEYNEAHQNDVDFTPKKVMIGYARVSTLHQNLDRQIASLTEAGCGVIFEEKASGKDTERVQFKHMDSLLQTGDVVVIADLTRLARSTANLTSIVEEYNERGIQLKSIKEEWLDTTTAQGKLMFTILSGLAQFERELTLERSKEGIAVAKAKGVKFGKQLQADADIEKAIEMYCNNLGEYTVSEIAEMCNVSRTTLWRRLRDRNLLVK